MPSAEAMKRILWSIIAVAVLGSSGAMAACPPQTGGTTAQEIAASQARILCLQNELADETRLRQMELDIKASERRLQELQLQQRMDSLPKYTPPPVVVFVPAPVVPPTL